jgi:hypothetical protein
VKKPATKSATKSAARKPRADFPDPAVDAVFDAYPAPLKPKLLALRRLIFDTAKATTGVGALHETLKWGQPSYLTPESKSGSTIRIDQVKSAANQYAIYFHCQTDLVETFRAVPEGVQLWRQPMHPFGRQGKSSRAGAAPLRGAGADLPSEQAQGGKVGSRSPDGAKRNPGALSTRIDQPRITLRSIRATKARPPARLPRRHREGLPNPRRTALSTARRSRHWAARG